MKQFLLFSGLDRYPSGGWEDFQGSFDSFQDAALLVANNNGVIHFDWWHVVDSTTGEIVK